MTNSLKNAAMFFSIIVLFFVFAKPAQAYLDPGTGSLILQSLLGAVLVLTVAGRRYWYRLLCLLRIKKEKPMNYSTEKTKRI